MGQAGGLVAGPHGMGRWPKVVGGCQWLKKLLEKNPVAQPRK